MVLPEHWTQSHTTYSSMCAVYMELHMSVPRRSWQPTLAVMEQCAASVYTS